MDILQVKLENEFKAVKKKSVFELDLTGAAKNITRTLRPTLDRFRSARPQLPVITDEENLYLFDFVMHEQVALATEQKLTFGKAFFDRTMIPSIVYFIINNVAVFRVKEPAFTFKPKYSKVHNNFDKVKLREICDKYGAYHDAGLTCVPAKNDPFENGKTADFMAIVAVDSLWSLISEASQTAIIIASILRPRREKADFDTYDYGEVEDVYDEFLNALRNVYKPTL